MFEDSTFESGGRIRTRSRAWSIATFALNTSILAALIVIPLIYPEALPRRLAEILLSAPPPPPAAPKPVEVKPAQAFRGVRELTDLGLTVPTRIPPTIKMIDLPEPPGEQIVGLDSGPAIPGSNPFGNGAARTPRVVTAPPRGPQRISSGVANGLLLDRILPVYPAHRPRAGIQGTVALEATISTSGTIENLRVVRGPADAPAGRYRRRQPLALPAIPAQRPAG